MDFDFSEEAQKRYEQEFDEVHNMIEQEKQELTESIVQKLATDGVRKTFTTVYNNPDLTFKSFYNLNKNNTVDYVNVMRNFLIGDRIRTTYKKNTVTGVVTEKKMDGLLSKIIITTDQDLDGIKEDHTLYCDLFETKDPVYFQNEPEGGYKKYQKRHRRQTKKELITSWVDSETLPF